MFALFFYRSVTGQLVTVASWSSWHQFCTDKLPKWWAEVHVDPLFCFLDQSWDPRGPSRPWAGPIKDATAWQDSLANLPVGLVDKDARQAISSIINHHWWLIGRLPPGPPRPQNVPNMCPTCAQHVPKIIQNVCTIWNKCNPKCAQSVPKVCPKCA